MQKQIGEGRGHRTVGGKPDILQIILVGILFAALSCRNRKLQWTNAGLRTTNLRRLNILQIIRVAICKLKMSEQKTTMCGGWRTGEQQIRGSSEEMRKKTVSYLGFEVFPQRSEVIRGRPEKCAGTSPTLCRL